MAVSSPLLRYLFTYRCPSAPTQEARFFFGERERERELKLEKLGSWVRVLEKERVLDQFGFSWVYNSQLLSGCFGVLGFRTSNPFVDALGFKGLELPSLSRIFLPVNLVPVRRIIVASF
jgi:hypothetical protein